MPGFCTFFVVGLVVCKSVVSEGGMGVILDFSGKVMGQGGEPPCVTFHRAVVSLRGPGQSPVLPFACYVGSLRSVRRCGRCSRWCRFRVRGAQWLVCRGCAGCGSNPSPPFKSTHVLLFCCVLFFFAGFYLYSPYFRYVL